jgi:hypothetical protein
VHRRPVPAQLNRQGCRRQSHQEGHHEQGQVPRDRGRQGDQRYEHQKAQMLGVPPPGQGQSPASHQGCDHEARRRRHPRVDGGHRDDVDVRGRDTRCRQRDRADPATGPAVEPAAGGHQPRGQDGTGADADARRENPRLGGEYQKQRDADQCHGHSRDGKRLADPSLGSTCSGVPFGRGRNGARRSLLSNRPGRRNPRRASRGVRCPVRCDGHRNRRRVRAGVDATLGDDAGQLVEVGRSPGEIAGHDGEVRGESADHDLVRFGHAAIVSVCGASADE